MAEAAAPAPRRGSALDGLPLPVARFVVRLRRVRARWWVLLAVFAALVVLIAFAVYAAIFSTLWHDFWHFL